MRIGLITPGFSADPGDWCIPALRHLARTLATRDDVRVVAVRYPYRRARYRMDNVEVIALGGADRRGTAAAVVWRDALRLLQAEHRRRRFDVLHAFWATESGLLAALAGKLLGIPTLVSLAGGELVGLRDIDYGDQRHLWERLKVRASLRLASAVTAGSALLVARAGGEVSGNRLYRAPLGVDLRLFTPDGRRAGGGARLIHVATLTRVKDQATLLRAFAGLRQRRREASLEIVGSGPLRAELERMVHALDLTDAVQFRGELDHAALPEAYRSADGFVLSSRHEAQGMVALEAAACGLPVAGTSVGVLPELTGDVAPVGASETLAAAMAATLAAPAVPTPRLRSEFGLDECTDRFRALYASLLAA